jgi:hypothetical protein
MSPPKFDTFAPRVLLKLTYPAVMAFSGRDPAFAPYAIRFARLQ